MGDLQRLIEAVGRGDDMLFRRFNRAVFSTPCQDIALQLREENCRHAYKGSLDDAKSLHEALLPGWEWTAHSNGQAVVWPPGTIDEQNAGMIETDIDGQPARALLAAILRAVEAKGGVA
ncbi:hypothetical protein [Paenirhodobacter enshiensis]|uniref:hypothetical protein n=1 Tax=Paenirhodobacter enshiensis TaxID=1105367 RepID=UPI0035B27FCC